MNNRDEVDARMHRAEQAMLRSPPPPVILRDLEEHLTRGEFGGSEQRIDEHIAERESLGRLVQQLFESLDDGKRLVDALESETGGAAIVAVDASVTFTYHRDGRDYRLSLALDTEETDDDDAPGAA